MCGIYASVSRVAHHCPNDHLRSLLCRRGPDHAGKIKAEIDCKAGSAVFLSFYSTVLALRGGHVAPQPLVDSLNGSILCWNGEAWEIGGAPVEGNDGEVILGMLAASSSDASRSHSISRTLEILRSISGPFAFVFFDKTHSLIYFGRDCLGRRSLLLATDGGIDGVIQFSSIPDPRQNSWREVEADGIYVMDFMPSSENDSFSGHFFPIEGLPFQTARFPWLLSKSEDADVSCPVVLIPYCPDLRLMEVQDTPLGLLNRTHPDTNFSLSSESGSVELLKEQLLRSLKLRVLNIPDPNHGPSTNSVRLAVLFSGGLDCTILARMADDLLPGGHAIDLLNVAFENPRVVEAARKASKNIMTQEGMPMQTSPYELCPDRITGRDALRELRRTCPNRKWRFVEVNVPYADALAHKAEVISLISPHNTEMDLSIAYALYFAARGSGLAATDDIGIPAPYTSPARVLLSGLGADELFGGYTRHATAYSRHGFAGLLDELQLDVDRLGKRNLGRDDRVISNWGREARFPYLDETLVRWALACPIGEKCGFGQTTKNLDVPESEIEPGKKVLRLLAWQLGMHSVAKEKKRAIQFGARTAKMETGRTKGTSLIS